MKYTQQTQKKREIVLYTYTKINDDIHNKRAHFKSLFKIYLIIESVQH